MIVGRVIGWIVLLAGSAVLVRDLLVWIDTKHWAPIALGQLWYDLNRSSLNLVQAVVQRYIHPFLWDPIIVSILLCWAFAVLMVFGALLLIVFRRRNSAAEVKKCGGATSLPGLLRCCLRPSGQALSSLTARSRASAS